jgi:hypothetical protein
MPVLRQARMTVDLPHEGQGCAAERRKCADHYKRNQRVAL